MKRIETELWCVSSNGETFGDADFSSREEALEECKKDDDYNYVGRAVKLEFTETNINAHVESIIEDMYDSLSDECGDVAENWQISTEEEIELGKRIAKVVIDFINEKGLQPTCFSVVDIEEVKKDG